MFFFLCAIVVCILLIRLLWFFFRKDKQKVNNSQIFFSFDLQNDFEDDFNSFLQEPKKEIELPQLPYKIIKPEPGMSLSHLSK